MGTARGVPDRPGTREPEAPDLDDTRGATLGRQGRPRAIGTYLGMRLKRQVVPDDEQVSTGRAVLTAVTE
jgi:hypothetical protein